MADRPVFLFLAAYSDLADAETDYEALKDLHAVGAVGTYDAALIRKDDEGKIHVHKREKPTQHGAWAGAAAGALIGIVFPPSLIATAIVGAGAGGGVGHLWKGLSRGELKDIGEFLDDGEAALVIVGESKVQELVDRAVKHADKQLVHELQADLDDLEKELDADRKTSEA